jgi:hypothetical protein
MYFGWSGQAAGTVPPALFELNATGLYAASPSASRITMDQWSAATPVAQNEVSSETPATGAFFTFRGKRYQASGKRWFTGRPMGILSPSGNKLALTSYDGPMRPSGLYFFDWTAAEWKVHLDVFQIASAKVIGHGTFSHLVSKDPPEDPHARWCTDAMLLTTTKDRQNGPVSICQFHELHDLD